MKRKCVSYHVKCATVDTVSHPQETGPVCLILDWYPQMIRFGWSKSPRGLSRSDIRGNYFCCSVAICHLGDGWGGGKNQAKAA